MMTSVHRQERVKVLVVFLGQAFGVGALEDEDEDVYTADALSNYDQTMELDDSEQLFGWTAPGARRGKGKQGLGSLLHCWRLT